MSETLGRHLHKPGNPVISVYAADPDAALFGDKYFIYATDAGFYPPGVFQNGAAGGEGHGFSVWSSRDLRTWQSEGPVLRFGDVLWAKELSNAWAPCIVERNGRFSFYFCADSRIGVAVADTPTGPFVDAKGEPLVPYRDDLSAIDPMVLLMTTAKPIATGARCRVSGWKAKSNMCACIFPCKSWRLT